MLAFDRQGTGPLLMLLHGTNSSRSIWKPLLPALTSTREVLSVDLPAHGESPPTSFTPPEWASELASLLDTLGVQRVAVVGHSSGGWTALELAKLGRASSVIALAPAGLWRKHSPLVTGAILVINWRLGQIIGDRATKPLNSSIGRQLSLRQISARPATVSPQDATAMVRTVLTSRHFPEHFKATRRLRFEDGEQIPREVPVEIVWGENDHIARARASRHTDQLPNHATIETWPASGHMLMWDQKDKVLANAKSLP